MTDWTAGANMGSVRRENEMKISDILENKPAGQTVTIRPDASVGDAARLLSERRIGALLVSETGEDALGILSERDIVRELGMRGAGCLTDRVSDLMTADIVTTTRGATAQSVLVTMTEKRFRHMPVMEQDRLIGLVSIGDIVSARLAEMSHENQAMQDMIMGR